jgi:deoxyribose-phosphate aldolase
MELTYELVAKRIDHSLLVPTLTDEELVDGCWVAARYQAASVCIKPYAVPIAAAILKGSGVAVGTTVGFPHGANRTSVKVAEAAQAIDDGAVELDMVVNLGKVLAEKWDDVEHDVSEVVKRGHGSGAIVKVIFENCYLTDDQKVRLCEICGRVKADFVKTSTGFGTGGATHADLALMRKHSPPHVRLKAAGGVRTLDQALAVIGLGCDRIGASQTAAILDELRARLKLEPIVAPGDSTAAAASGY